jgi:hypothetical protein
MGDPRRGMARPQRAPLSAPDPLSRNREHRRASHDSRREASVAGGKLPGRVLRDSYRSIGGQGWSGPRPVLPREPRTRRRRPRPDPTRQPDRDRNRPRPHSQPPHRPVSRARGARVLRDRGEHPGEGDRAARVAADRDRRIERTRRTVGGDHRPAPRIRMGPRAARITS